MKRIAAFLTCFMIAISFSGCIGDKINPAISKMGLKTKGMQRITITNYRYAGRYTIIDKKSMESFTKLLLNAKDVKKDSKLDPDFIFEFYDDTKNVASFKYIAGIEDGDIANLTDNNGRLYHISTSIEDEFMKRLMKRDSYDHVPEYYITLIKLLMDKIKINKGNIIVVDISRDYVVTRSITSMEQKSILGSISSKGAKIKFPSETKKYNYVISINTSKYSDNSSSATATIQDTKNNTVKFEIIGAYQEREWNYHIKYK